MSKKRSIHPRAITLGWTALTVTLLLVALRLAAEAHYIRNYVPRPASEYTETLTKSIREAFK